MGAWELLVTRLASVLFFIGIAHLVVAVSLLGFSLGAILAKHIEHKVSVVHLATLTVLLMPATWLALSYSNLSWIFGSFALPFLTFGAASAVVWQMMRSTGDRSKLYCAEAVGTVVGLILVGPFLLSLLPIYSNGEVGYNNHLTELLKTETLREHQQWSSAYATTDLVRTDRNDSIYFFTDARFVTRSVAWDGHSDQFDSAYVESLAKLKRVAFGSTASDEVLLLGAGAGFDIAVALQSGSGHVEAVEVNGKTIEIATLFDDWAGGVMSDHRVSVHIAEARRFTTRQLQSEDRWDQINLTLLQTSPSTGRGSTHVDGRVLTREALETYLALLKPCGTISIIQNTERLAHRTTATVLSVVESQSQLLRFELPVSEHANNPFNQLIVVSGEPFSTERIKELEQLAEVAGAQKVTQFTSDKVATDDKPFLFESLLASTIHILVALSAACVLLTFTGFRYRHKRLELRLMLAATVVGAVVMAIQALVIYRMQAAIGNPVLALSLALSATLIGGGIGALVAQSVEMNWLKAGLGAMVACLVLVVMGDKFVHLATQLEHLPAAGLMSAFVLFCSLPIGLPFLLLMQQSEVVGGESLVLASDGVGGVLGAAMAVVVPMMFGFSILGVAILFLLVIFCVLR